MSETQLLNNKLIVFQLEDEEYAITVRTVGSIERILPITRVPSAPNYVKGVINLRGVVTPVIDLKQRLKNKPADFTDQTRIIIVNLEDMTIGLIVDSANDVIDINRDDIEPSPETVDTVTVEYIDGVLKLEDRLLILLNLEKTLAKSEQLIKAIEG